MRESLRIDSPFMGAGMPKAYSPLPARRKSLEGRGAAILAKVGQRCRLAAFDREAWPGFTEKSRS
jgi:hypothetical protein